MDPDTNLTQQLDRVRAINAINDGTAGSENGEWTPEETMRLAYLAGELAELVESLDQWIRRSGNPPHAWTRDHAGWHQDGFVPTVG